MRRIFFLAIIIGAVWLGWSWLHSTDSQSLAWANAASAQVELSINGMFVGTFETTETSVSAFLSSEHIALKPTDVVFPQASTLIVPGLQIMLEQARPVSLQLDGKKISVETVAHSAEAVLTEAGIVLDEDDIVEPSRDQVVAAAGTIRVIQVEIREEHQDTDIPFTTKVNEDSELSWRVKKVTQAGAKGKKRTNYRVSYHDGKEVRRRLLATEVIKEPVTEVVTQGTYVKLGKSHRGAASWYAWTGTMAAANPWLPKGSYVKVTNLDNGKSVIVVINDRGPFVPGRIIDLDKVAFAKIASIGAGVINVKMEEIVN